MKERQNNYMKQMIRILVIVHYKDDATAGNGAKKGTIHNKGIMNNEITALIFNMLEEHGIKNSLC